MYFTERVSAVSLSASSFYIPIGLYLIHVSFPNYQSTNSGFSYPLALEAGLGSRVNELLIHVS